MKKNISIAIDGPAAAGKSTVSKEVARRLNFTYIDTGAMYRAVTYYAISHEANPRDEEAVKKLIPNIHIELNPNGTVICSGEDVTKVIRTPLVSSSVSYIAAMVSVRLFLVEQQRKMANSKSVVMDGRDIGTYVLPNADVKIYQIASVKTRAERRFLENQQKNIPCTYEEIEQDVINRDRIDSSRSFAPLKKADDAIELDTSNLTIEESVQAVLDIIKEKVKE